MFKQSSKLFIYTVLTESLKEPHEVNTTIGPLL